MCIIQEERRSEYMNKEQAKHVLIAAQTRGHLNDLNVENFEEWDSIEKMNFFVLIEEVLGKEFQANILVNLKTYDSLIEFLEGQAYEENP